MRTSFLGIFHIDHATKLRKGDYENSTIFLGVMTEEQPSTGATVSGYLCKCTQKGRKKNKANENSGANPPRKLDTVPKALVEHHLPVTVRAVVFSTDWQ